MDFVVKIISTKAIQNAAENAGLNGKMPFKMHFWGIPTPNGSVSIGFDPLESIV